MSRKVEENSLCDLTQVVSRPVHIECVRRNVTMVAKEGVHTQCSSSNTVQHCANNGGDSHFLRSDVSRVLCGWGGGGKGVPGNTRVARETNAEIVVCPFVLQRLK